MWQAGGRGISCAFSPCFTPSTPIFSADVSYKMRAYVDKAGMFAWDITREVFLMVYQRPMANFPMPINASSVSERIDGLADCWSCCWNAQRCQLHPTACPQGKCVVFTHELPFGACAFFTPSQSNEVAVCGCCGQGNISANIAVEADSYHPGQTLVLILMRASAQLN